MDRKKYGLCILLIVFFFLIWWRAVFYNENAGFEEAAVTDGNTSFTAVFDTARYIVISNEDISVADRLNQEMATVTVKISDHSGNEIARCISEPVSIHTNGFTSSDNSHFTDLPVQLKKGEVYHLSYKASLADGSPLTHLSFMVYGDRLNSNKESLLVFGLMLLAILVSATATFLTNRRYIMIYLALMLSLVYMMPMLQSDDEMEAFGNAYGYSSQILGKSSFDDQGNVYIDESGLRNMGYLSYSVPLKRFWTDYRYGNDHDQPFLTGLYRIRRPNFNLIQVPEILAVTIARMTDLPYQFILLSGWLVNSLLTGGILAAALHRLKSQKMAGEYLSMMFLLPSVMIATMSYTGTGILIALCALYWSLCKTMKSESGGIFRKEVLKALFLLLLIISVQYAYCVLVVLLLNNISQNAHRWQILSGIAVETVGFALLKQVQESSLIAFLGAVINTIFVRLAGWLKEMVAYHFYPSDGMVCVIYLALIVIVLLQVASESQSVSGGAALKCTVEAKSVIALLIGIVLLMTSEKMYSVQDEVYSVMSGITGEMLIPFLFIPCLRVDGLAQLISNRRVNILRNILVVCACWILATRMGRM